MPEKQTIVQNAVKIDLLDQLPLSLTSLLSPYSVFLIGETHGTKESPAFCLGLIKMLAVDKAAPILLALEISEAEQPIFDEFMRTGDPKVFGKSNLFKEEKPYGISSEAMVQLLISLRLINNVRVLCSLSKDPPSKATFQENQEERDSKWASFILERLSSKNNARVVVLGGSFHMSLIQQMIVDVPMKTMGFYLINSKECLSTRILSIDIKSKEVNAWGCFSDTTWENIHVHPPIHCGEMTCSNPDDNYSTALEWDSYFLMEGARNATLFIRKLSASKPFRV